MSKGHRRRVVFPRLGISATVLAHNAIDVVPAAQLPLRTRGRVDAVPGPTQRDLRVGEMVTPPTLNIRLVDQQSSFCCGILIVIVVEHADPERLVVEVLRIFEVDEFGLVSRLRGECGDQLSRSPCRSPTRMTTEPE